MKILIFGGHFDSFRIGIIGERNTEERWLARRCERGRSDGRRGGGDGRSCDWGFSAPEERGANEQPSLSSQPEERGERNSRPPPPPYARMRRDERWKENRTKRDFAPSLHPPSSSPFFQPPSSVPFRVGRTERRHRTRFHLPCPHSPCTIDKQNPTTKGRELKLTDSR